jgi:hypothetical protein
MDDPRPPETEPSTWALVVVIVLVAVAIWCAPWRWPF